MNSCEKIDAILDSDGFNKVCFDCQYYQETYESHPYGGTFATETIGECLCDSDALCPRLRTE